MPRLRLRQDGPHHRVPDYPFPVPYSTPCRSQRSAGFSGTVTNPTYRPAPGMANLRPVRPVRRRAGVAYSVSYATPWAPHSSRSWPSAGAEIRLFALFDSGARALPARDLYHYHICPGARPRGSPPQFSDVSASCKRTGSPFTRFRRAHAPVGRAHGEPSGSRGPKPPPAEARNEA